MDAAPLADLPLMAPPPGQHSNFDAPTPLAKLVWVLMLLTIIIAALAVTIRMVVKVFISKQRVSWDDGTCFLALGAGILQTYIVLKGLDYGYGKHMWDIRKISMTHERLLKLTSFGLFLCLSMLCVRVSILSLYQRLFGVYKMSKKLIVGGYVITFVVALSEIGCLIARMKLCTTIPYQSWCTGSRSGIILIAYAITWMLVDIYIYSIALFRLRLLQINSSKRIQLMVLFGFGLVALTFGFCCFIYTAIYFNNGDRLWGALRIALFKTLEANIALTCACAISFPALWRATKASSSLGPMFRSRSANLSLNQSQQIKPSEPEIPKSNDGLVDSPIQLLEPAIHTKRECP